VPVLGDHQRLSDLLKLGATGAKEIVFLEFTLSVRLWTTTRLLRGETLVVE
jgi:hypothetical protein